MRSGMSQVLAETMNDHSKRGDKPQATNYHAANFVEVSDVRESAPKEVVMDCLLCKASSHSTSKCFKLNSMSIEMCKRVIYDNHLCFACLSPGHRSSTCYNRLVCEISEKRHPTVVSNGLNILS